ncbi:hypothetical protein ACTXMB_15015 [Arthrobacter rhombi]|uniref:hypothetical protein n=1 Tax=Arthrobacter rhombi TaxID=71253 RepID=UPI003FD4E69F
MMRSDAGLTPKRTCKRQTFTSMLTPDSLAMRISDRHQAMRSNHRIGSAPTFQVLPSRITRKGTPAADKWSSTDSGTHGF